jgi:hypothetical protein
MRIQKNCKRLDFKTGSLKVYYFVSVDEVIDIDYVIERLREMSRVPRNLMG